MKRKIILQGNNAYTVTLPIKWVRDHELKESSEIEINEDENNLSISVPLDQEKKKTAINVDLKDYNENTIKNIINQFYRKGYDQIYLKYSNKTQLNSITHIARKNLLGFEVSEDKDHICLIENIAEPSSDKFDTILRKIFFIIEEEGKEILDDFKNKQFKKIDKKEETKELFDTYTNLCRRLIIKNKIGGKNSYNLSLLLSRLSLIYHSFFYMYKFYSSKKPKLSKETITILEEISLMFRLLQDSFYKKDINKANEIDIIKNKIIYHKIYNQIQNSKGQENVILYHLGELTRLIHLASTNVFGLLE